MISDNEMDEFEAAIVAASFAVHDFNVVPLEDEPTTIEQLEDETAIKQLEDETAIKQYVPTGTVTIQRISTDEAITYKAGSGSIWWQAFEADLHEGKFGEP